MKTYDVIVIGGGPAGLSAAIYTSRANYKTLLIDKGGCLNYKIGRVHNYLGFPEGIDGKDLIQLGCKHIRLLGSETVNEEVLNVKVQDDLYIIQTNRSSYAAKGLIIAMGVSYKKVSIANLEKFEGRGISYCVTCDGFFFRGKKVLVIGSENYAAMEALELTDYTSNVTIYTNGLKPEIDDQFLEKLKAKNIEVKTQRIISFTGDKKLEGIMLEDGSKVNCDGVFIAVGSSSAADIALKLGVLLENGYIKVDNRQRTNLPRVYAAGDCTGGVRQIATAVGQGATAAVNLIAELKGLDKIDYY
ncbi:MAG: NAD(P)/FAD-dependent oxidoreductase [Candidatus Odinarchaeum yellowstonii]|uniref:NAD(P)/FAD-dependent oxidoreductase n=1 Tax=Odinarchaeota yellowstonii (strain LCB_4) TaxID=1841599 RepID=A0AAF0D1L2_ODILC|nr:MAG: NAD(P)/FAD-dependent oxidoreductase [Candidatus Odinarchaeum yellowstonii]